MLDAQKELSYNIGMTPTKEDLVVFGHLKPEDLRQEMIDYKQEEGLSAIDRDYARSHGLSYEDMKAFKEDMIIEEEIEKLNLELNEKYDVKPHFAW